MSWAMFGCLIIEELSVLSVIHILGGTSQVRDAFRAEWDRAARRVYVDAAGASGPFSLKSIPEDAPSQNKYVWGA